MAYVKRPKKIHRLAQGTIGFKTLCDLGMGRLKDNGEYKDAQGAMLLVPAEGPTLRVIDTDPSVTCTVCARLIIGLAPRPRPLKVKRIFRSRHLRMACNQLAKVK